jgi:tetratricopeptide (TPR) repeat protein
LKLSAFVRDEVSGRTIASFTASGSASDISSLADAVAEQTGASIRKDLHVPAIAAMRALFGTPPGTSEEVASTIEKALAADPTYGSAHLAAIDLNARLGRLEEVRAAMQRARTASFFPAERAQMDAISAEMRGDQRAHAAALGRLAELEPGNLQVSSAAAQAHMRTHNYPAAVRVYDAILELVPDSEPALNGRGYAWTFAGDLERAKEAFAEYRRLRPESANAIDSLAEVMFYFGHYAEAEKLFLEAHSKNPAIVNGQEPFRAALSRFMAGDVAGADARFAAFMTELQKRRDPLVDARRRAWQWMTGRAPQEPAADPFGRTVAALWTLAAGNRDKARELAAAARAEARIPRMGDLASTVLLLAQPSASAAEWSNRVIKAVPGAAGTTEAKRFAAWALLFDRQPAEAAKLWRELYESARVEESNVERMALATALVDSGQIAEARKVMPHGFLPPAGLDPGLNLTLYPRIVQVRRQLKG